MTATRGGLTYLDAAREVLRRHGKPMHYTGIVTIAMRLGLLQTNSVNPSVQMSAVLNRAVKKRDGSEFRRIRSGVFALSEYGSTCIPLGAYDMLGQRIDELASRLRLPNRDSVLKRALRVARACEQVKGGCSILTIGDRVLDFGPDCLCSDAIRVRRGRVGDDRIDRRVLLSRSLAAEYSGLARSLSVDLGTAIVYSVRVLEVLVNVGRGGAVTVSGKGGRRMSIWLR